MRADTLAHRANHRFSMNNTAQDQRARALNAQAAVGLQGGPDWQPADTDEPTWQWDSIAEFRSRHPANIEQGPRFSCPPEASSAA